METLKPTDHCIILSYETMVFEYNGISPKINGWIIQKDGSLITATARLGDEFIFIHDELPTDNEYKEVVKKIRDVFTTHCEHCIHKFNYRLNGKCDEQFYST